MILDDKFIAFIDILGFKDMVRASEAGTGLPLPEILDCLAKLGTKEHEARIAKYGPTICPQSDRIKQDLDFTVTQVSDCAIVSSEVSPAGVINLVNHCYGAVMGLLVKGIMCRGYITRGTIFHDGEHVIGTGYQKAFEGERNVRAFKLEADERGTPFVEIDLVVCRYVESATDPCVREMFSRMVKTEDGTTAVFPFKRLSHSFAIGGFGEPLDSNREKEANENVRKLLRNLRERVLKYVDPSNEKAVVKARHYLRALEAQFAVCDSTDEIIDMLCQPFPRTRS